MGHAQRIIPALRAAAQVSPWFADMAPTTVAVLVLQEPAPMAHVHSWLNVILVYIQAGVARRLISAEVRHGPLLLALVIRLSRGESATTKPLIWIILVIIPVGAYTHLIFSFLYIDPDTYEITPMESNQTDLYARFTTLKQYGVETWITIGGWAMNDPGEYSNVFSDLAASSTAQKAFLDSLVSFLGTYGFDGVDFDWEYPGAPERFGNDADYANFVSFLQNVRSTLGDYYGLSITLPSSYWYLQYFDIVNIAKTIDWFNFMSYDIYGTWDATISSIGNYVYASTNLTMIESGLQLLWHNNITASQVNLGLGYYGRSYTLKDSSCTAPGCPFTSGAKAGPCSRTEGMLSYDEIMDIIDDPSRNPTVWLDSAAAVKIAVYDDDQWVAYDDAETLQMKLDFANSVCMGGVFAWAVDEDHTGGLSDSVSNSTNLFPAGGSGKVYVLPEIWDSDSPEISCQPPCTFILPPFPLPTTTTVSWPAITTTLLVSSNGGVTTTTTTIPVPEFPLSVVPFWPVTIANNQTFGALNPVPSVTPPSLVLNLPGSVTPFPQVTVNYTVVAENQVTGTSSSTGTITSPPSTTITASAVVTPSPIAADMTEGCTQFYQVQSGDSCWSIETTYDIAASDFEAWNPDVGTGCSSGVWLNYYYCIGHGSLTSTSSGSGGQQSSTGTTIVPIFPSTSHPITIQPQPTVADAEPSITIPPINVVIAPPTDSSSSDGDCQGCGNLNCELFGCDGKCGFFGCDGGCGLWWCGGGCGLEYCGPGCSDGPCIVEGGGGGGGSTGTIGTDNTNDDCSSMETADICTVFIKSFSTSGMTSTSTTTTTECYTTEGCSVAPSTTTTTISTTGTYSTITNSFMFVSQPTEAASVMDSISASIVSQRSVWDATRWAGYTITVTPTSTTTSSQAAKTGFEIIQLAIDYSDSDYSFLAINYDGLSNPIVINDTHPFGEDLKSTNSQTTFCDQTSTFVQEDSGDVLGSSNNGNEYDCTTVVRPVTTTTSVTISPTSTNRAYFIPMWQCLTNICD
ncbi:class V chitinase, putative [Talaromyces stipitatus ATCC 10500]|uniref:chitinase n=1 Tax=Talaromyces stipitatus (strain ATCC 10500 / CBS 375.48 / QM 6759 / NRRL 1006) TaxID=441959 RepID=B8M8Y7_TALSN|nr:class V chitinase, putative [Talaromyces stipitatus ATCC 10500]EED17282.1 class V chitinase, putative [Talaromyces stipitatus ATCC 10500]